MIYTFIKHWLVTSLYFYTVLLVFHFQLPLNNTHMAFLMNPIHASVLFVGFMVAGVFTLYNQLLDQLNKHYKATLICLLLITLGLCCLVHVSVENMLHITLFSFILSMQLISYHQLNKSLTNFKRSKQNQPKPTKKISKLWLILGILFVFTFFYTWFLKDRNDAIFNYQTIYPTEDQIKEIYSTENIQVDIGPNEENNTVNINYAYYTFDDYYISRIASQMEIKGKGSTVYTAFTALEKDALNQQFETIPTIQDDLQLYFIRADQTNSSELGSVLAIFETTDIKVYTIFYFHNTMPDDFIQIEQEVLNFMDHLRVSLP